MVKEVVPQEDNTSNILKADLLKYGYINKRYKLRKNHDDVRPAKCQEWLAIKLLEEERNNLVSDLNAAMCKSKVRKDDKYRMKFARTIREIKQIDDEYTEQRKIELEVDKEIFQLEAEISALDKKNKSSKNNGPKLTFKTNNEYNRLLDEQNQLKTQVESLLKQRERINKLYNKLMNKLHKGQQIASDLSEQVARTYILRDDAKERLEIYLKTSKTQNQNQENNLLLLKRQFNNSIQMTEYVTEKLKSRTAKTTEKNINEHDTEMLALNVEAEEFIKHLIYITDEKNLEKIMEEIVKMNFDNRSMFKFLLAIELHLTDMENAMERSRTTVADKKRALSDMLITKKKQFENMAREYKDGCTRSRDARRTLRTLASEWIRTCQVVDEVCDLMGTDCGWPLAHFQVKDSNDGKEDEGGGSHCNRILPDPPSLRTYFGLVDGRLNDVLYRLFYVQNNCGGGVGCGGSDDWSQLQRQRVMLRPVEAGESMSTGSEQEDDFVARNLDGDKNRQAKMMASIDPTAVLADDEMLDVGQVPSICPECLEKRFEEDKHEGIVKDGSGPVFEDEDGLSIKGMCHSKNINLKNISNDALKMFFHRTVDCPLKFANNSHKKMRGNKHNL
ncbi:Hypothetical protein CINCED_3A018606 [Cinara cedri]|uniref:ODAD1 central coiled coil region domain-containing protein n=1 Tax=Cinara cedri TaxID=506608 RepID=A0A5E4NSV7_9HEMI|nr:Hypothetical protein CINCED_3A018606 [Cinara cedri]